MFCRIFALCLSLASLDDHSDVATNKFLQTSPQYKTFNIKIIGIADEFAKYLWFCKKKLLIICLK